MLAYRSHDGYLAVCQDNEAKTILITEINSAAEEITGYQSSALVGKPLGDFLPPRIAELMSEYVEFEQGANDVGAVLAKVQSFSLVSGGGKEIGFRLKVVRLESTGNREHFRLILQDKQGHRRNEAFRSIISENFKGHEVLDSTTGLPDRYSLSKDIELMLYYTNKGDLQACFAILQLDYFDDMFSQYGRDTCQAMMAHIAANARQSLRNDDTIGTISHQRIGLMLMDTSIESARLVLNRLRWQIAANPFILPDKTTVGLSASIGYARIGGRVNDKNLLTDCEEFLDAQGVALVNALSEISEVEKRKLAEG